VPTFNGDFFEFGDNQHGDCLMAVMKDAEPCPPRQEDMHVAIRDRACKWLAEMGYIHPRRNAAGRAQACRRAEHVRQSRVTQQQCLLK
jgi:hypothetical protein